MGFIGKPERYAELAAHTPADPQWLWDGYLAAGGITLLTSQWKTGKTTLLSVLLSRLPGGGELAGRKIRPGRAAVISEEDRIHWRMRGIQLDFGPDTRFFCRPFFGSPQPKDWQALIDQLLALWADEGLSLVVIDTLATLLPAGAESQSDLLLRVLRPLEQLTEAGIAVLLMHHPRKGHSEPGQSARGTGALTAYVDIILEMTPLSRTPRTDRRRRLSGWSRYDNTAAEVVIELNAERTDYQVCIDLDDDLAQTLRITREVLLAENCQMSRALLHERWPHDPKPALSTLWKHLERLVELGLLTRSGSGERKDPFRYSLPDCHLDWSWSIYEDAADFRQQCALLAG